MAAYAAASLSGSCLAAEEAHAGIRYTYLGPTDVHLQDFDLNHDGVDDFEFFVDGSRSTRTNGCTGSVGFCTIVRSSSEVHGLRGLEGNRILVGQFGGMQALAAGATIDGHAAAAGSGDLARYEFQSRIDESRSDFGCAYSGWSGDFAFNLRKFIGLQLESPSGETRYAGADIGAINFGYVPHGFAYETEAGAPIAAGAAPGRHVVPRKGDKRLQRFQQVTPATDAPEAEPHGR